MGLFWPSSGGVKESQKGSAKAPRRTIKITEATARNLSCSSCSLNNVKLQTPKMPPSGAAHPLLYIMGAAPNKNDDAEGNHFSGSRGDFFRDRLPESWDGKIRWNNTLRCSPGPANLAEMETECCRRLQIADIEESKPKIIIAAGRAALQWFLGSDRAIQNWRRRRMPVKVGRHVAWLYVIEDPYVTMHWSKDKKKGDAYLRAFERDIESIYQDLSIGLPDPYVESPDDYLEGVRCLTTYGAEGIKILEREFAAPMIMMGEDHTIDIETNMLRPYAKDARILTTAIGQYGDVFSFPWEHPEARWTTKERGQINQMMEHYLLTSGRKWAHRATFEMEWMHSKFGPDVLYKTQWGDTIGQAHVLDERPDKDLDSLTQMYFGFRLKDVSDVDRKNMEAEPLSKIIPYNGMDTKYQDAVRILQSGLLEASGLTSVYESLHARTRSFVQMQAKGVVRNMASIHELHAQMTKQAESIKKGLMVQPDVLAYQKTGKVFNPTSPTKLVPFFKDYLKIKNPNQKRGDDGESKYSVDEGSLSKIKHPVAAAILELRSVGKNQGYVTPLFDGGKYVHGDGLVHASYSQYVTVSGRSACSDPNQQNYPRRQHKEVRRVVGCPPGHVFAAFDYGQLEWRVGAMASRDKTMILEIVEKQDVHGVWTDGIGGRFVPKKVKENRKKVRDSIKQYWTFANLYGNLISGVAWDLSNEFGVDITVRELQPFFDAFWNKYPALQKYQQGLIDTYWKHGYVETITGQRRHEPMARNEIINHPFQGTAGHLVMEAQDRISQYAYVHGRPQLQPIMNIHDDLSFYLPMESLEQDIEDIARMMCSCPFKFAKGVPLSVECSIGDNWCDKEEVATFYTTDFV